MTTLGDGSGSTLGRYALCARSRLASRHAGMGTRSGLREIHRTPMTDEMRSGDAVLLPSACFGRPRSTRVRSEKLIVTHFEAPNDRGGIGEVRHRALGSATVILEWRSVVLPSDSCFYLPGLGQFLDTRLRPLFDGQVLGFDEAAVLSDLAGGTLGAVFLAGAYECSVRVTLSLLSRVEREAPELLDRPVIWIRQPVPLRDALLAKWSDFVSEWSDTSSEAYRGRSAFDRMLGAMEAHQSADRAARISRCISFVSRAPTMDAIREVPGWEAKLGEGLARCDDSQIEYLSECGFWSYSRFSSDAYPFRNW